MTSKTSDELKALALSFTSTPIGYTGHAGYYTFTERDLLALLERVRAVETKETYIGHMKCSKCGGEVHIVTNPSGLPDPRPAHPLASTVAQRHGPLWLEESNPGIPPDPRTCEHTQTVGEVSAGRIIHEECLDCGTDLTNRLGDRK